MYKIDLIQRKRKINKKNFFFNNNVKDVLFINQVGLKKRVMEKIGFVDSKKGISSINFVRLIFIFNKYPGLIVSPRFGKF
jgi:hypothetical protein